MRSALVGLVATAAPLFSAVIADSRLTGGNPYSFGAGLTSFGELASGFTTPSSSYVFSGFTVAIGSQPGLQAPGFTIDLRADASGEPGATLESFTYSGPVGLLTTFPPVPMIDFTSTGGIVLSPLTQYWLVLSPSSIDRSLVWNWGDSQIIWRRGTRLSGSSWQIFTTDGLAFAVFGDPSPTVVPEPAQLSLIPLAIGLALAIRARTT